MAVKKEKSLAGKVNHYFEKIGVAVVDVLSPLKIGDEVRFVGGQSTDFNQKIESMQADHKEVSKAKKGDCVGMKVLQKVREGYKLFKI